MSKDLITKLRVKGNNSENSNWTTVPIGVESQNVILDKDSATNTITSMKDYMDSPSGGRNYLVDTSQAKTLVVLEDEEKDGKLLYMGADEEVYTTYQEKTLKELGFKEGDMISFSFDWTVRDIDSSKNYDKTTPIQEIRDVVWDEGSEQKPEFYVALKNASLGTIGEYIKVPFGSVFNSRGQSRTITNQRYVLTNSNPYQYSSTTASKTLTLKSVIFPDGETTITGHFSKKIKLTSEYLELKSFTIQSDRVHYETQGDTQFAVCKHIVAPFELEIKNFILEKGLKTSDWSPAPEDVQNLANSLINIPIRTRTDFEQQHGLLSKTDYLSDLTGSCYLFNRIVHVDMQGTIGQEYAQHNTSSQLFSVPFGYAPAPLQDIAALSAVHTKSFSSNGLLVDQYGQKIGLVGLIKKEELDETTDAAGKALDADTKQWGAIHLTNPNASLLPGDKIWITGSYMVSEDTAKYFGNNVYNTIIPADDKEEQKEEDKEAEKSYTVTFNSDGGSTINPQTVNGYTAITLPTPTKENNDFLGWYDGTGIVSSPYTVTRDITLRAMWQEGTEPQPVVPTSVDLLANLSATSVTPSITLPTLTQATFTRRAGSLSKSSGTNIITICPDAYSRDNSKIVTYYGAKSSKSNGLQGPILELKLGDNSFVNGTIETTMVIKANSSGSCGMCEIFLGSTNKGKCITGLSLRSYSSSQTGLTAKTVLDNTYGSSNISFTQAGTSDEDRRIKIEKSSSGIRIYENDVLKSELAYTGQDVIDRIIFRFCAYQVSNVYQRCWKQVIKGLTLTTTPNT